MFNKFLVTLTAAFMLSSQVYAQIQSTDKFIAEQNDSRFYLAEALNKGEYSIKSDVGIYRGLIKVIGTGKNKGRETLLFMEVNCNKSLARTKWGVTKKDYDAWDTLIKNSWQHYAAIAICQ